MKSISIFSTLVLASILSFGQLNQFGHPVVHNFTPEEYNGVAQNWAVIQDDRGLIYVANSDKGILEYDGVSWRSIPVDKNAMVRSFAKDDKGTIYVGTVGDFGYLAPNKTNGLLEYKSLLNLLTDSIVKNKIQDIYKTHFFKNKVYFCSRQYIVIYDGKTLTSKDLGDQAIWANLWTFVVNNRMYIGSFLKGLREFHDDTITLAKGGSFYEHKNIFSIVPLSESQTLIVSTEGLYFYNQETGESKDFTNNYLKKVLGGAPPTQGQILSNHLIGISTYGTDQPTFLTFNELGVPSEIFNKDIGLQDSWVYSFFENNNSSLWLAEDLGISKVEIQSAFRKFDEKSGFKGSVLDIVRFKSKLYIATSMGVFYLENNEIGFPHFVLVNDSEDKNVFSFQLFVDPVTKQERLLAGAQPGLFEVLDNKIQEIKDPNKKIDFVCWKFVQLKSNPSRIYVGITGGLTHIDYKNGYWDASWVLKDEIKDAIKYLIEDSKGYIWASTDNKGVIQIKDNGPSQEFKRFGEKEGLPNSSNVELYNFGDSLIVTTSSGLFLFDYNANRFNPCTVFKGLDPSQGKGIHKIAKTTQGYAFSRYVDVTYSWAESIVKDSLDKSINISIPFKYLPKKWISTIWADPDGTLWFGILKELYSFNPRVKRNYNLPYKALVRKVTSKDSVLFNGAYCQKDLNNRNIVSLTQNSDQIIRFPYRFNRMVFEFSAPFFEKEEATEFSVFLEGSDESWSIWNKEPKAVYTNLTEGSYTFKVKARNVYGVESSVGEYKFSIAPPWYRTIIAYIFYAIVFILCILQLLRWNARRLIAEKERLEQIVKERTAEVVRQKDEIEIQNEKISIQNEEIKSSIHYASRIQNAILTPDEQIQRVFNEYFILYLPRDIVSGDFYWITKVGTKKICVVADCTGHGVPGGFMSMLGMSFVSQIISKGGEMHSGDILNQLRSSVINSLHQTGEVGGSKDGMDITIYVIDEVTNILEFSGANNPLIHIRGEELNHIKGDKMPIGIHLRANEPFTTNTVQLQPGDCIYTFSDGYADQFGGPDQRKFMIKNLKDLLLEIHKMPMAEQRDKLHKTLLDWHGDSPRIDDVVVMGVRV